MKFAVFVLAISLFTPHLGFASGACEVISKSIIEEIGAIRETGSDFIDAKAGATQTCMDRYQEQKHLSFDDAFDICVNRLKCSEESKKL